MGGTLAIQQPSTMDCLREAERMPPQRRDARTSSPLRGQRIALFSGNYNYVRDGANQALNRLVRHLEAKGGEVRVYSPTTDTPAFAPAGTLIPVRSIGLPGRSEYRLALGLPQSIKTDLVRFAPHLVHLSAPDWLGAQAQRFALKTLGVPVVASLHTRFETYLEHYGIGFIRPAVENYLHRFYERCAHILVPSRSIAREMASLGAHRVHIWGRGVDAALFDAQHRNAMWRIGKGFAPDDILLLFFGRLVREKGTHRFAEIARLAMERNQHIRPLIIGDGPARSQLARDLPAAVFTGQLTGVELATAIASADVMLNPSLSEAFGNVNLEAMASGLSIVAADCESCRNLMTHQRSGWLCDPEDIEHWTRAVLALAADRTKREKLGREAQRQAANYGWDCVLNSVVQVYLSALPPAQ
jgi:phosphatidylinositol alpha 1,6-mannosyltransferase